MRYTYNENDKVFLVIVRSPRYAYCNCNTYRNVGSCRHCDEAVAAYQRTYLRPRTEWQETPPLEAK